MTKGAVARVSLGVLAGAHGRERCGGSSGPRPKPNARAAPRDRSCTEEVSEAGAAALSPRSGWEDSVRGQRQDGRADSCSTRAPPEPSSGCPVDDRQQGERCLQLRWPERSWGQQGVDPSVVRRAVRISARLGNCSGSPTSTESSGRAWTVADVVGSDFPSAAPVRPFLWGGGLALRSGPLARARPPSPALQRGDPGVQAWGAEPAPSPLGSPAVRAPCLGKSWWLGRRYTGRFSEHATGF